MDFKAKDIEASEFYSKYPKPIVLAVQPEVFKVLEDPEDLRKWEQMLAKTLGLKESALNQIASLHLDSHTCSESGRTTNDCDED